MAIGVEHSSELQEIKSAIEDHFGMCPSFFSLAADSPPVVENLFMQAKFAYLDAPFPSLFKEELFAYLSRFCLVPYCMLRHSAFLIKRPAGDQESATLGPADVVALLRTPLPTTEQFESYLDVIRHTEGQLKGGWVRGSELEKAVFFGGVSMFLKAGPYSDFRTELRRFLGPEHYYRFGILLAFVNTAHFWTELYETLSFEPDVDELLLAEEPELASWLVDYRNIVARERESIANA